MQNSCPCTLTLTCYLTCNTHGSFNGLQWRVSLTDCGKQVNPPAVCSDAQGFLGQQDLAKLVAPYLAEPVGQYLALPAPAHNLHFKGPHAKPISILCCKVQHEIYSTD